MKTNNELIEKSNKHTAMIAEGWVVDSVRVNADNETEIGYLLPAIARLSNRPIPARRLVWAFTAEGRSLGRITNPVGPAGADLNPEQGLDPQTGKRLNGESRLPVTPLNTQTKL